MVLRRSLIALAVLVVVSVGLWGLDRAYNQPARNFVRSVTLGMTRDRVRTVAGAPRERLAKGSTQLPWGGTPKRIMPGEAWVYYFGLGNVHRVTVLFRGGVVAALIVDRT